MLGRQVTSSITSTEFDNTRSFTYSYDRGSGTTTRVGPDDIETFTSLDDLGRLAYIRRGPSSAPIFWASYAYEDRGLLETITRSNDTTTGYTYDAAQRVTVIDHRNLAGTIRKLEYTYFDNDLVETIAEENEFGIILATTNPVS